MIRDYIAEARNRFPKFSATYESEDGIYLLYGALGSFMLDVINLRFGCNDERKNYYFVDIKDIFCGIKELDEEIVAYFNFIDELYLNGEPIRDVLNTCIFESLMESDFSYNLARRYLSKDCFNYFLEVSKRSM
jgi:hypothetical protein